MIIFICINFINNAHIMEKLLFSPIIANQETSLGWLVMGWYEGKDNPNDSVVA